MRLSKPLPNPQPDVFSYRLNKVLCLALSPARLLNYFRYRLSDRTESVSYFPIKLDFENVSRCNFRCSMCPVSEWDAGRRADDLSYAEFKSILDGQVGVIEIKLQGLGEPLLGKDEFFRMIRYARKKRIWVRTSTNASILDVNDNYRKLYDAGVNEIQISVDGVTKETYEAIRRGGSFERLVKNCTLINNYSRGKRPRPLMWVLLQKRNQHEFKQFIPFAYKLGFVRVCFALDLNGWADKEWTAKNQTEICGEISEQDILLAVEEGKKLGINVGVWINTQKYSATAKTRLCPWPFERAFISSDGKVVPCCIISNPDTVSFGSARDFQSLWFGKVYTDFRRSHLAGAIPPFCSSCYEKSL